MDITAIVSVISIFIGAPAVVFSFVYLNKKAKYRIDELRLKKEMLELEVEKEKARTKAFEAESAKYDRIIDAR